MLDIVLLFFLCRCENQLQIRAIIFLLQVTGWSLIELLVNYDMQAKYIFCQFVIVIIFQQLIFPPKLGSWKCLPLQSQWCGHQKVDDIVYQKYFWLVKTILYYTQSYIRLKIMTWGRHENFFGVHYLPKIMIVNFPSKITLEYTIIPARKKFLVG